MTKEIIEITEITEEDRKASVRCILGRIAEVQPIDEKAWFDLYNLLGKGGGIRMSCSSFCTPEPLGKE